MALDKIKNFFGVTETEEAVAVEEGAEDVYYKVSKAEVQEATPSSNKMILFEPRAYSESSQIVDYLKYSRSQFEKSNTRSSKKNYRLFNW